MTGEEAKPLSIWLVPLFFFLAFWQALFVLKGLQLFGLEKLRPLIIDTGISAAIIVPVLVQIFVPSTFTHRYWHLPKGLWKGVAAIIGLQIVVIYVQPYDNPVSVQLAISALVFSPILEEIVRAVMLPPLTKRLGTVLGVLLVSVMCAYVHNYSFFRAEVYQLALTIIFIKNDRSIPGTAVAHFVMNAIGVAYMGIQR